MVTILMPTGVVRLETARLEAQARELFAKATAATGTPDYAPRFKAWTKVYRAVIRARLSQ